MAVMKSDRGIAVSVMMVVRALSKEIIKTKATMMDPSLRASLTFPMAALIKFDCLKISGYLGPLNVKKSECQRIL